jgi:hypothetical protein
MALIDSINLAATAEFRNKVTLLVVKAAHAIMTEGSAVANHTERVNLAKRALVSPESVGVQFAYGVVTNAAITAESTDGDIEFTVNSMWNAYAGVETN